MCELRCTDPVVFDQFYEAVTDTECSVALRICKVWKEGVDPADWEEFREMPVIPGLVIPFAAELLEILQQLVQAAGRAEEQRALLLAGSDFLAEVVIEADQLGIDVRPAILVWSNAPRPVFIRRKQARGERVSLSL